ncbi:MAG TPA: response regulator [Longimicrobium sp.]|nr:response regulator [Longimicrobium sp.]
MSAPSLSHAEALPHSVSDPRPPLTRVPVPRMSNVQPPESETGERAPVVLIAEDHEDSRDALRTLLDAFGFRVVEAGNGREAVERALAERPDVILMDMMMPYVDGFQATREIRAVEDLRNVPILAITAMEGARQRVLEAGCDDLVPKPIDVRAFLDQVRAWARRGHAA